MIKIKDFQQGVKKPNEWTELHELIDLCFSEYDSFAMQFTEQTVDDTIEEIKRYCATKAIEVDCAYIEGSLYVERIYPEPKEADQPLSDMPTYSPSQNGNGTHKRKAPKEYKKRFSAIVHEMADSLILDSKHEVYISNSESKELAKAFYNYSYRNDVNYRFEMRHAENGLFIRKISKKDKE